MTPAEHYVAAEVMLAKADRLYGATNYAHARDAIAMAHVHATLALIEPGVALVADRAARRQ